jgi:hypothetical protein
MDGTVNRRRGLVSKLNSTLIAAAAAVALSLGACDGDSSETTGADSTAASDTTGTSGSLDELCFDQGKGFDGAARLYIEHNATDEDTGVHGMFDHEGLAEGCIQTPDGAEILLVNPTNQLGELGINELFFESREPPNDEYSIADLKADFPEGDYRISGIDFEGTKRVATATFTHDIPTPPKIVSPKVVDEEKADQHRLPASGVTVRWQPVTQSLDGKPVEIVGYEVIVTDDEHQDPDALSQPEYDVHVPPNVTELAVPDGFLEPGKLYELEVLALEKSGNQTISLGFFTAG